MARRPVKGLTLFELIVVACIIFIFIGSFAVYADITLRSAREVALKNELVNIRMAIEYFRIINGRLPGNLSALLKEPLTTKYAGSIIIANKFLQHFRLDKEGNLIDPFLHKYIYDEVGGAVYSKSKGHERW